MEFEILTKSIDTEDYCCNDDGSLTITGVASTTNRDLDGEIVSSQALQSFASQAVGLNLHLNHNHEYDGGIGAITDAYVKDDKLFITADILSEYAEGICERLKLGMNFGFSIGGVPYYNPQNEGVIDGFTLYEVSLTLFPANWDTFGTVTVTDGVVKSHCISGACNYIIKNRGDKMVEENNPITEERVIALINEALLDKEKVIIDEIMNRLPALVETTIDEIIGVTKAEEVIEEEDEEVVEETKEPAMSEGANDAEEEDHINEDELVEETKAPESESEPEEIIEEEDDSETTLDEKSVNAIANQVMKRIRLTGERESKLKTYKQRKTVKKNNNKNSKSFLDSEERDKFGRKRKYL